MVNLNGIREEIRVRTGLPEKGTTGKNRLNNAINYAYRRVWRDMPWVFLKTEYRLQLAPSITDSTISVDPVNARVFRRDAIASLWATNGRLDGRWIDITDTAGRVHRRRIREAFRDDISGDWGGPPETHDLIVVDAPWMNVTDEELSYRIHTVEYPYPADFQSITEVIRDPETNPTVVMSPMGPEEADRLKLSNGWTVDGVPERYCRGDFYQLRAPHEAPETSVVTVGADTTRWGFHPSTGNEHDIGGGDPKFGPAGTFKYRYCLGWGRLANIPAPMTPKDGGGESLTDHELRPFYISAPSEESPAVTTTWGQGRISVKSANQDWIQALSSHSSALTWNRTGLQKWWFRARTASEDPDAGSNNAQVTRVESDSAYYLWRITDADITTVFDQGGSDPPDINFPLQDFSGHQHIRFDKSPSDNITQVLIRGLRRPTQLQYDTDMLLIPPEAVDAVVCLACSYLAGERDGNIKRAAEYLAMYAVEVKAMRSMFAFPHTRQTGFGDGIGTSVHPYYFSNYPVREDS